MKTIFLHGFSGDRTGLQPLADSLGLSKSYLIDLPSFGRNARRYEPTWASYAEAVMETIQDETGDGPYRLIGHSHGAMVAFVLAAAYPERIRELVLICPVAYSTKLGRAFITANTALGRVVGYDALARVQRLTPIVDVVTRASKQADWPAERYDSLKQARRTESRYYNGEMLKLLEMVKRFTDELQHATVPLAGCIVQASRDLLVSQRDIAWFTSRIHRTELVHCRGGHVAPAIFPDELARLIHQNLHILYPSDL